MVDCIRNISQRTALRVNFISENIQSSHAVNSMTQYLEKSSIMLITLLHSLRSCDLYGSIQLELVY